MAYLFYVPWSLNGEQKIKREEPYGSTRLLGDFD